MIFNECFTLLFQGCTQPNNFFSLSLTQLYSSRVNRRSREIKQTTVVLLPTQSNTDLCAYFRSLYTHRVQPANQFTLHAAI